MRTVTRMSGYTLVEILVVIAIIGILISLTATQIGPALERARQMQCAENLRQIAIATANFESSNGHLPAYCEKFGEFFGGIDPSDPDSFGGSVPRHMKIGSWNVAILAQLDRQPIFEHWTSDRYPILSDGSGARPATVEGYSTIAASNISTYICPSATGSIALTGFNNYVANTGLHSDSFPFTYTRPGSNSRTVTFLRSMSRANATFNNQYAGYHPGNPSTLVPVGKRMRTEYITDGAANTMLYTENNQAQPWYLSRLTGNTLHLTTITSVGGTDVTVYPPESRYLQGVVWHFEDDSSFAGAAPVQPIHKINGGDVYNDLMTTTNFPHVARPSSLHNDGVNMVMADGSVRFVTDAIDYQTYQALLTPNGHSSDVPSNEFIPTGDEL